MSVDCQDLLRWLDSHPISRQKKNLHRDFSDAVPVAEILKQYFPRNVDLHNYTSTSSLAQKIINWKTLNWKVLNKMKINLNSTEMQQLANACPGAIERLLTKIRGKMEKSMKVPDCKIEGTSKPQKIYVLEEDASDISLESEIVPIQIKKGTHTLEGKVVPLDIYRTMECEICQKDEELSNLKLRVSTLENLLHSKEQLLKEFTESLQQVFPHDEVPMKSRFFNRLINR